MLIERHLILSQSEWGELFSSKKFNLAAYLCIFIGFILLIINDGIDLIYGIFSLKSVYSIMVFAILASLGVGVYRKQFYSIPFAVIGFDFVFIVFIVSQSFVLGIPINVVTVCYSVMYFIINSLIFSLTSVFVINFSIFAAVAICVIQSTYAQDTVKSDPSPLMLNALILSAAGFLLQHLVLTVRAMIIEQLGTMKLQMAALEAEMEIENAKKEAREKAIQLNRISIVEALGASIAHEINQPIAAALTYCQAARNWSVVECRNAPETLHALDGVENNVGRAARLIDNIRLLTTQKDRKYVLADISVLVGDQVNLIHTEFDRRNIKLKLEPTGPETKAVVCASEVALATMNLLRNAMEAFDLPADDALVSVHCRQPSPGWIEILVIDNGRGLSPECIETAFAAFQTTKETGIGIGLSICQEVAEHHLGSMSLTANANGGLTATLRLATNLT
jgi:signal transduction histidine kinase